MKRSGADDESFVQTVDWQGLQVFEKFVPNRCSRSYPVLRGTHYIRAQGQRQCVLAWIAQYEKLYPTAGYGTVFTVDDEETRVVTTAIDAPTARVVYMGSRWSSCD